MSRSSIWAHCAAAAFVASAVLSGAPHAVAQTNGDDFCPPTTARDLWRVAETEDDCFAYQTFLDACGATAYAPFAERRLERLDCAAAPAAAAEGGRGRDEDANGADWGVAAAPPETEAEPETAGRAEETNGPASGDLGRDPLFALTRNGLGPLRAGERYTLGGITRLFPGYIIVAEPFSAEGAVYERIVGLDGETRLFDLELVDDAIRDIRIFDARIVDPIGARVGARFSTLGLDPELDCFPGEDATFGETACVVEASSPIQYWFDAKRARLGRDDAPILRLRFVAPQP